ncbi:PAS domain-containing protein [Methylobacterium nigriterrae]|uniref:PAS domain-containing protein n=1 Tax=Methylobacterium nigriterrae TaxID=3127512 RepID=UPI003013D38B
MASSEPIDGNKAPAGILEAALNASDVVGMWGWDVARSLVTLDEGAARLLTGDGALAGQVLELDRCLVCVHPEDAAWLRDHITQSGKAGGPFLCEYRVCGSGHGTRWVLSRGRIELGPDGEPARGQGILIDITETRLAGETYFATPVASNAHPLEQAADHCIAARRALDGIENTALRNLMDVALWEIGRELARRESAERRRSMN